MEALRVDLDDEELRALDAKFPQSLASAVIGKRAEEIVKIYFRRTDPKCKFSRPHNGADLEVQFLDGQNRLVLEIKGTDASSVSWQKLKVSSEHSWRHLVEERIPVYRVIEVFGKSPSIIELLHDRDFTLEPEPRWSFKPKRSSAVPSPLAAPPSDSKIFHVASTSRASKYARLAEYLSRQKTNAVTLTFAELRNVLGFPLPSSATKYQAFWGNQLDTRVRPWARAWQKAGYRVDSFKLHPTEGWVRFARVKR